MHRHAVSASLLLLGIGLLAGCGQKGPLFLPTKPAASAPAPSTSVPAPASPAKPAASATVAAPAPASSGGG